MKTRALLKKGGDVRREKEMKEKESLRETMRNMRM